jgi:DNA-binding Lrp family transcriptional regulator
MPGFDDRTVSLDAPEQLADLGSVLASRTRLAVLRALMLSDAPLHINEIARRIGVDASPVRTHLELLLKERLVREVDASVGRERKFTTSTTAIRVTLENVNLAEAPHKGKEPPKVVQRLTRKLAGIAEDVARLEEKARRTREEIEAAWAASEERAAQRAKRSG